MYDKGKRYIFTVLLLYGNNYKYTFRCCLLLSFFNKIRCAKKIYFLDGAVFVITILPGDSPGCLLWQGRKLQSYAGGYKIPLLLRGPSMRYSSPGFLHKSGLYC